ncbi:MAG TPA: hypothetical protein VJ553_01645 [Candidatus Paceibacterota bacterium]|nr:hypothetical protein [Candidatus Paceibacterota bacterium]
MADAPQANPQAAPREPSPALRDVAPSVSVAQPAPSPTAPRVPVLTTAAPLVQQPRSRRAQAQPRQREALTYEEARQDTVVAYRRYQKANQIYLRQSREREEERRNLHRQTRRTSLFLFLGALLIAGFADLLSIVDAGWLISWAIPLICVFIARRIDRINRGVEAIHKARERYEKEYRALLERLGPALRDPGAPKVEPIPNTVAYRYKAYIRTFIAETVAVQIAELVPVIDALPMYLGQVVRVVLKQYTAHRNARLAFAGYDPVVDALARYQRFEVQYLLQKAEESYAIVEDYEVDILSRQREEEILQNTQEEIAIMSTTQDIAFAT